MADHVSCVVGGPQRRVCRPSGACAYPAHFMVAVEIFEAAASRHPEVLEGLTLPTSLDPTTTRAPASQDAKPAATDVPALPAPAPAAGDAAAVVPAAPKPAGEKSRPAPPAWSVLNGLVDLMADWAQLKDGSPEVGDMSCWGFSGVKFSGTHLYPARCMATGWPELLSPQTQNKYIYIYCSASLSSQTVSM